MGSLRPYSVISLIAVGWLFLSTSLVANSSGTSNGYSWVKNGRSINITGFDQRTPVASIPSKIEGLPVTTINDDAFKGCESIKKIIIPFGVTSIGERAFGDCSTLLAISIPDSIEAIGQDAFAGCNSLVEITAADDFVKYLGSNAIDLGLMFYHPPVHAVPWLKSQRINFPDLPPKTFGDSPVFLKAISSSKLPVLYWSSDTNVADFSKPIIKGSIAWPSVLTVQSNQLVSVTNTNTGQPFFSNSVVTLTVDSPPWEYLLLNGQTNLLISFTNTNTGQSYFTNIPAPGALFHPFTRQDSKTWAVPYYSPRESNVIVSFTNTNTGAPYYSNLVTTNYSLYSTCPNLYIRGAGTTTITAIQPGDGIGINPAPPVSRVLVVKQQSQKISFTTPKAGTSYNSQSLLLNGSSSQGLPISYSVSDPTLAQLSTNGTNTFLTPLGVGKVIVTATQGGNENVAPASPVSCPLSVTKGNQTLSFSPVYSYTLLGSTPLQLSATSDSGLPVSFFVSPTNLATISGNILNPIGTGTITITATQSGDSLWNKAKPVTQSLTITTLADLQNGTLDVLSAQEILSTSWTRGPHSDAKKHALLALKSALSQLQREAGPDQRVTATADLFNTNPSLPNVSQPYWTGVWKTFNPAWTYDPARSSAWNRIQPLDIKMPGQSTPILRDWSTNATNVVWLVSGATDNTSINPFHFGALSPLNSVTMATGWGGGSNTVSVPLVSITNRTTAPSTGRYAYWVSDEGVKAKVNITETNLTKKPVTSTGMLVSSLVHYLGRSAPYLPSVMTNFGVFSTSDLRTNPFLSLITNFSDLKDLDPSYAGISNNALSGDLTLWSYGVLSDVRRGGLKQDLTAAMESSTSSPSNFQSLLNRSGRQSGNLSDNDSLMAYRASTAGLPMDLSSPISNVPNSCLDGLRWQSIYNFYNLYKSRWPQSPLVSNVNGIGPVGVGFPSVTTYNSIAVRAPAYQDPAGSVMSYSPMTPAVVSESVIAQLGATNMMTTNGMRSFFQVSYYPLAVLYNPYSVALDVGSSAFCISKNLAMSLAVKLTCKDGAGNLYGISSSSYASGMDSNNLWPAIGTMNAGVYTNTVFQALNGYAIQMTMTNPPGTLLLPGEVRVYGFAGRNSNYTDITLQNYSIFSAWQGRQLVSTSNLTIGSGFGGVTVTLTNWAGSTAMRDTVSLMYPSLPNITYNTHHFSPQATFNTGNYTISTWPWTNFACDLPGSLSGTSRGGYSGTTISTTMGQLAANPVTVVSVTERLKGTVPASQYLGYIGVQTNIPTFLGNSLFLNGPRANEGLAGTYCPATETCTINTNEPLVSIVNSAVASNASTLSWVFKPAGDDPVAVTDKSTNNNVFMVLRDVPIAPMTSLGQLMHLEEFYNAGTLTGSYNIFPLGIPGMSIGGSFCCPETGPFINSIFYNGNGAIAQWHLMLDNSFLANEALFDSHFFSTVPPPGGFTWGSGIPGMGTYSLSLTENSIASDQPLPNPRHVFYRKNWGDPSVSDLQDEGKAAANLMVNGAFNVNSTSVVAWKALLTSLNGQTFPIYNYISGQFENRYVSNPILRFWSVGRYNPNDAWDGMRSLTDQQVTSLAQEIVKQVRARGPFLSMGDFLNRRMASINSLSYSSNNLMGALQAAIENTQTNGATFDVNSNIHNKASISTSNNFAAPLSWSATAGQIYPSTNGLMVNMNQIATNTATSIPGYLMQQDLVQAFAPVMTVRSDTFRIRVYGDTVLPTKNGTTIPTVTDRIWGEALVQRVPDFVDQTDPALTQANIIKGISSPLGDATPVFARNGRIVNELNESLGRRFRVISFRWLEKGEL